MELVPSFFIGDQNENRQEKYTYELDELTAYKLETIVEVMHKNNHTAENGKRYSKNIAIAEAIDCYYNSVINHDPDFLFAFLHPLLHL